MKANDHLGCDADDVEIRLAPLRKEFQCCLQAMKAIQQSHDAARAASESVGQQVWALLLRPKAQGDGLSLTDCLRVKAGHLNPGDDVAAVQRQQAQQTTRLRRYILRSEHTSTAHSWMTMLQQHCCFRAFQLHPPHWTRQEQ